MHKSSHGPCILGNRNLLNVIPISAVDEKSGANSSPMELWGRIWLLYQRSCIKY